MFPVPCSVVHLCITAILLSMTIAEAVHAPIRVLPRCWTTSISPAALGQPYGQHLCTHCSAVKYQSMQLFLAHREYHD